MAALHNFTDFRARADNLRALVNTCLASYSVATFVIRKKRKNLVLANRSSKPVIIIAKLKNITDLIVGYMTRSKATKHYLHDLYALAEHYLQGYYLQILCE